MYKPMYDVNHRFRAFSLEVQDRPVIYQKGLRERLLCDDCEQLLANNYEGYAAEKFYRPAIAAMQRPPPAFTLTGLQYAPFKLFLLSLLWRLGSIPSGVFRPAELGDHSETLRKMLLNGNPGDWLEYPCMITAVILNGKFYADFTAGGFDTEVDGIPVWGFVLSGFLFNFLITDRNPPRAVAPLFLQPNGTQVIAVEEMREIESLYEFACEIGAANIARRESRS